MKLFDFFIMALFHDLSRFSIHGLWPTRFDGSWPSHCADVPFNASSLANLEPRLHHDWPATHGREDVYFHKHEFEKHGTCSGLKEHQYFARSLEIYDAYDLNNLTWSFTAPLAEVIKFRFKERYGKDLIVSHESRGRATEVRFCVDDQWQLMECPLIAFLPCAV